MGRIASQIFIENKSVPILSHHNGFRTYDPSTGRYIQSDPIGLDGGKNTYSYVNANPIMGIDFFGLITWKGQVNIYDLGMYVGAARILAELTSECKNGERYTVFVEATAVGINFGILPASYSISENQEFVDGLDTIDPYVFNGSASIGVMGAQFGKYGGSISDITLGGAHTPLAKYYGDINASGGNGIAEGLLLMPFGKSEVIGMPYSVPCNNECE